MTEEQIIACAKYYARATAVRAVHGEIPAPNSEADEANWGRTRKDVREGCLEIMRAIATVADWVPLDSGDKR